MGYLQIGKNYLKRLFNINQNTEKNSIPLKNELAYFTGDLTHYKRRI